MARNTDPPSLADYVVLALSPVLIMGLVGSLVFFLAAVLYTGPYAARLNWTLFFFVGGAVLVSRIAIQIDSSRAGVYGLYLAGVTYAAMLAFVGYPEGSVLAPFGWLINLGLIGIVWWSANRLTWDCTYFDEKRDASDVGLLEAAGLEQPEKDDADIVDEVEVEGESSWWQRLRQYRARQARKPHTPGRWVVYFSLAALPLFGLGQVLIPAGDAARRQWAFWLMTGYVGCGLGLLLTTAFLGLRRYLRQRKLTMPMTVTGLWLGLGGALVFVVILVGAILPRPNAEYSLVGGWTATTKERDASQYAVKGGDAGKGDGRSIDKQAQDPNGAPVKGKKGDGGDQKGEGKDEKGPKGEGKSGEKGDNQRKEDRKGENASDAKGDGQKTSDGKAADGKSGSSTQSTPTAPQLPAGLEQVATVLKWVVFAALAVVVVIVLLRAGLGWLANFSDWAKNLLAWLRGFGSTAEPAGESVVEAAKEVSTVPFSAFTNPFDTSEGDQKPLGELVEYTFAALEAWATERDLGRRPDETPLEFAERLREMVPDLAEPARRLADWLARLSYGGGRLPASCRKGLAEVWQAMESAEVLV